MPLTCLDDHTCRACGEPVLYIALPDIPNSTVWFSACEEVHDIDLYGGLCEIPPHWSIPIPAVEREKATTGTLGGSETIFYRGEY